jgi:hypothetical protein
MSTGIYRRAILEIEADPRRHRIRHRAAGAAREAGARGDRSPAPAFTKKP